MTDLPDAVVELTEAERATLRSVLHEFKSRACDDDCSNDTYAAVESIVAARLAAASGPWEAHLDAANELAIRLSEAEHNRDFFLAINNKIAADHMQQRIIQIQGGISDLVDERPIP